MCSFGRIPPVRVAARGVPSDLKGPYLLQTPFQRLPRHKPNTTVGLNKAYVSYKGPPDMSVSGTPYAKRPVDTATVNIGTSLSVYFQEAVQMVRPPLFVSDRHVRAGSH